MSRNTAIYLRLSRRGRDPSGQTSKLKTWAETHGEGPLRWYREKAGEAVAGTSAGRPGLGKLLADIEAGKVARLVVWRLDRLGLTVKGLSALLDDLLRKGIDLVSLEEGIDLATPAGRILAAAMASVAAYETEARAARILAGQAAARASGKRWGGSEKGRRLKVTPEQEATMHRLRREGQGISAIARATGLSRPTVYRILGTGTPEPEPTPEPTPPARRKSKTQGGRSGD